MAGLGDLLIRLRADTAEFESDMGRAAHISDREMERMSARATAAGLVIGQAITAAASHFARLAVEVVQVGDQLHKMSQRSGIAVERLSEIKFAGDLADVSMGQLNSGLGLFNKALAEAQNEGSKVGRVFAAMGVDINSGPQAAFDQFMRAINTLPDGEQKVAAMRVAFGRAGDALIPMSAQLDEASDKARRLGLIIGKDLARDSEAFNDTMKTLGATTQSLAIQITGPMVSGLSSLTQNLLNAKMAGDGLVGVWREMQKITAALISQIPVVGNLLDGQIEKAFGQRTGTPGATGSWEDASIKPVVNTDALRDAVANSRAVTSRVGNGRASNDGEMIARQWAEDAAEWAKIMSEASQLTDDFYRRQREGEASLDSARMQAWLEFIDREREREEIAMRAAAGFDELGRKIKTDVKDTNNLARDLGLTFTSAFEDAVTSGKKLSDVLKSLAQDVAKLFFRQSVTEPLFKAVSGAIGGAGGFSGLFDSLLGGGGGVGANIAPPVQANISRAMSAVSGGGGGPVVNISMPFSASTPEAVRAAVVSMTPQIVEASKRGTLEAMRRGDGP